MCMCAGEIWKPNISLGAAILPISLPIILAYLRYTLAALRVTGCTSFLAMENEFSLSLSSQGFPV